MYVLYLSHICDSLLPFIDTFTMRNVHVLVFFYPSPGKDRCNVSLGEKMLLQTTGSP